MSTLTDSDTYTFTILIKITQYTVSCTQSEELFVINVSNNTTGQEAKYDCPKETAERFMHHHGKELEADLTQIMAEDLSAGRI